MNTIGKLMVAVFVMVLMINTDSSAQDQAKSKTAVINVQTSAMCGACKSRIEKAMAFEKGVMDVVLDMETKIATITYKKSKTNPEKLRLAIAKVGYDADKVPADKTAYEKLPACCQKGGMD